MSDTGSGTMVLARFLARAGIGSRRSCEALIRTGAITINGRVVSEPAVRVDPYRDRVSCHGRVLSILASRYYLLNKPRGYVCSSRDRHASKLAIDLLDIPRNERVYSIGRLDKDSEGLLLFTNDGDMAQTLMHPRFGITKTYRVYVDGPLARSDMKVLEAGIIDDSEVLKAVSGRVIRSGRKSAVVKIVVAEGKKREIRRMAAQLNRRVTRLLRIAFGPIKLGTLESGSWRPLTDAEVRRLQSISF